MRYPLLFGVQAILLIGIALVHAYALVNESYWYYPLLNRAIHFSGGLWAALATVWTLRYVGTPSRLFRVLLIVMLISVGWEIFEIAIGVARYEDSYALDTILDLIMDFSGGVVGFHIAKVLLPRDTMENR